MNDNSKDDPLPFVRLAAVTRNVMEFLLKDQCDRQRHERAKTDNSDKENNRSELPVLRRNIGT